MDSATRERLVEYDQPRRPDQDSVFVGYVFVFICRWRIIFRPVDTLAVRKRGETQCRAAGL